MIIYILTGILFIFLLEQFTSLSKFKKYSKVYPKAYVKFSFWERFIGVLGWPILLGVFCYNFFKQLFK